MATSEIDTVPTVGPERKALYEFSTEEIVSELTGRAGVKRSIADIGAHLTVWEEGPVDIIVVKPNREEPALGKKEQAWFFGSPKMRRKDKTLDDCRGLA